MDTYELVMRILNVDCHGEHQVHDIWLETCEINDQTESAKKFKYRLKSKSSVYGKLYIPIVIWIKEAEMRSCYCQS